MAPLDEQSAPPARWSSTWHRANPLRFASLIALPALAVLVLGLIAWSSITFRIPVYFFTRDMATLAGFLPFVSLASRLGAFLMCATATVCLFAASVARASDQEVPWHLFATGVFSLYLATDDFYEFHDRLLPYLGVPQQLVCVFIAATAAAIAFRWWRIFLAYRLWLVAAALFFLSLSVACDVLDEILIRMMGEWQFFWEDAAKLMGISLWATYFLSRSHHTLSRRCQSYSPHRMKKAAQPGRPSDCRDCASVRTRWT